MAETDPNPVPPLFGTGRRPKVHALWHLKALGVVGDTEDFNSGAWEAISEHLDTGGGTPVRVFLIDTPISRSHPNLPAITHSMGGGRPGAHGTAMAGLIAARPQCATLIDSALLSDPLADAAGSDWPVSEIGLPYCGVNPFAEIVSIDLPVTPDPRQVLAALDQAFNESTEKYDVVVIADSWDRTVADRSISGVAHSCPNRMEPGNASFVSYGSVVRRVPPQSGNGTAPLPGEGTAPVAEAFDGVTWGDVDEALRRLCRHTFVLCAAGNEPTDAPVYPASLSRKDAGPVVVCACGADGAWLSYSPQLDENTPYRAIKTLSSEHPRRDKSAFVVDPWAVEDEDIPPSANEEKAREVTPFDIVTTDLPGSDGYNPSAYEYDPAPDGGHLLETASLYCRFSGTSAATAIAGGLLSLASALRAAQNEGFGGGAVSPQNENGLFDLWAALALFDEGVPKVTAPPDS